MSVIIPTLRFDEENSPSGVWLVCSISVAISLLILMLQALHRAPISAPGISGVPLWFKWLGYANGMAALSAFSIAVSVALNCIYHPIPKSRRDGFVKLNLGPGADQPEVLTRTLNCGFGGSSDDVVNSSTVEVRDKIQWSKMLSVGCCICITEALVFYAFRMPAK